MQQFFLNATVSFSVIILLAGGRHAADIHLQPPGFLAHTAQTEP